MHVFRSLGEVPPDFGPSALTIGNFDGVHMGHRSILRRLVALARERAWRASVVTFDPHPTRLVAPERSPKLLTTPERRAELMRQAGVDQVLILPFTREVAQLSAEAFVADVLVEKLAARAVLVGDNFRFGRGHAGDVGALAAWSARFGYSTEVVPAVKYRGHVVSSSGIRQLILAGHVSRALRQLERPYDLRGDVVNGRGVGSRQTVPTLNLAAEDEVIPAAGVYVTHTEDLETRRVWASVTNIGYRPTFGASEQLTIETFLLDPFDGVPPRRIAVQFLRRLRGERTFASPAELKTQILQDAGAAARFCRRVRAWVQLPWEPA